MNTVKNKKLIFLNNFWTVHGTIKIRIYSNSWECTYPFKKSKKSTKNCKMFTVKKTEKQLFPFILITKRDIAKILTDLDSIKSDRFVLTGGWIFIQNLTVYLLIKLTCYLICIYRQLVVLYYTCEDDGLENHNAPGITSYEQIWSELDNTNFYIFTQFFFLWVKTTV